MNAGKGIEAPSWITDCKVRISKKARKVLLRVMPGRGLEVVVPVGFDDREIPGILLKHQAWIMKQLKRSAEAPSRDATSLPLPESIELRAIGLHVGATYHPGTEEGYKLVSNGPQHIEIYGNPEDRTHCFQLLREWLKILARRPLVHRLDKVSAETGLAYQSVQIRGQRSRWGSFSSRGTLSLNWKLVFLPPELVRYLMIHELCHSVHLNHSGAFWRLVQRHEPDFRRLDARLRKAKDYVPLWADHP
jgi:predicted metal-dependent hydrolase